MKVSEKLGAVPYPNEEFLNGDFSPPVYICKRAKAKPQIDGDIFKPFWDIAERTIPFRDIEGKIRPNPLKDTWAKLLWDDENLYLGAVIYDDQIWANVKERDEVVFHDNDFEFFLDRTGTTHGYFELEVNALGTLWDLLLTKPYRDGGQAIDGFDFKGIECAVKIDGELNNPDANNIYWSVEIKIPWKGIAKHGGASEPPKPGEHARFNLSRVEWRVNEKYEKEINPETNRPYPEYNWVYAPTGVVNIHYPELWGFLVFADDFEIPEYEKIKWELRKIYYLQRNHYANNGCFMNMKPMDSKSNIKVEKTDGTFHAHVIYNDLKINITHDGYTWIERV